MAQVVLRRCEPLFQYPDQILTSSLTAANFALYFRQLLPTDECSQHISGQKGECSAAHRGDRLEGERKGEIQSARHYTIPLEAKYDRLLSSIPQAVGSGTCTKDS